MSSNAKSVILARVSKRTAFLARILGDPACGTSDMIGGRDGNSRKTRQRSDVSQATVLLLEDVVKGRKT